MLTSSNKLINANFFTFLLLFLMLLEIYLRKYLQTDFSFLTGTPAPVTKACLHTEISVGVYHPLSDLAK